MKKNRLAALAIAATGALVAQLPLAGCAMGGMADRMGDQLPQALGGLPEDAPARPSQSYQYPAVHDMPAARPTTPLDDAGQLNLQKDLQALRDRQKALAGASDAPEPTPSAPAKKKATGAKTGQGSSAKPNP